MLQLTYEYAISKKMTAEVRCGNCIFMDQENNTCHRRPPIMDSYGKSFWVKMDTVEDYCGEFKSVKKYEFDW